MNSKTISFKSAVWTTIFVAFAFSAFCAFRVWSIQETQGIFFILFAVFLCAAIFLLFTLIPLFIVRRQLNTIYLNDLLVILGINLLGPVVQGIFLLLGITTPTIVATIILWIIQIGFLFIWFEKRKRFLGRSVALAFFVIKLAIVLLGWGAQQMKLKLPQTPWAGKFEMLNIKVKEGKIPELEEFLPKPEESPKP